MSLDLFGIKIGTEEKKGRATITEYHITKKELLESLGFEDENVTFIQYDYKKGMLLLKTKK